MSRLFFKVCLPYLFMTAMISQDQYDRIFQKTIALHACQYTFEFEIQVSQRSEVPVGVGLQALYVRVGEWDCKRMVHPDRHGRQKIGIPLGPKTFDPCPHQIQQCSIWFADARRHPDLLDAWMKITAIKQLVETVSRHKQV